MSKVLRRGYVQSDDQAFHNEQLNKLKSASEEVAYLLNRGYPIKQSSVFVGNHYLLSERQRLALVRATSSSNDIILRQKKLIKDFVEGEEVNIDGFNTIITLEVALSKSILLRCMDGTIRDLAGLRGTYRIIDKTHEAVELILKQLESMKISKVNFYLDAPVSNSGRLKGVIAERAQRYHFVTNIEVINNVDSLLEGSSNVITSDAIILNKCKGWINLNDSIIRQIEESWIVDFR